MQNTLLKLIVIGAIIGAIAGAVANISGAGVLDYTATYNFPGADDNRINKNLDENPNIPPYERQNTVFGGIVCGLILGALLGVITMFLRSEGAYILSAVTGFLLSGFVVCPYIFYKFLPPVAHKFVIWVVIPGSIISVLISIFLEKFKPAPAVSEPVPASPVPPPQQQQGKKKNR